MARTRFKKLEIYGSKAEKDGFLEAVQKLGAIELHENPPAPAAGGKRAGGEEPLEMSRYCIKSFSEFMKKSMLESFLPQKLALSDEEVSSSVREFPLADFYEKCRRRDERISELESTLSGLHAEHARFAEWFGLKMKLSDFRGTETLGVFPVKIRRKNLDELREKTAEYAFVEEVRRTRTHSLCVAGFLREKKSEFETLLSELEAEIMDLSFDGGYGLTPGEAAGEIKNRIAGARRELSGIREEKAGDSEKVRSLMILHDYHLNRLRRQEAEQALGSTESVFFCRGWIPENRLDRLAELVESGFPEVHFEAFDPGEGEESPVLLENPPGVEPFESVTELYGMPRAKELDPTPFLAPFFAVFFALCMADTGYGAVIFGLSLLMLKRAKLGARARNFVKLIALSGAATIIAGILTGGYFGVQFAEQSLFSGAREKLMLFDPMEQFLLFMLVSLGLGVLQVWFGYFVKMLQGIKSGRAAEAAGAQAPWLVILPGFILLGITRSPETVLLGLVTESPLGAGWERAAVIMVYAGIAGMFIRPGESKGALQKLGLGVYSLYGLIGCLGDILSYVRIFALGLATVAMAIAINTMAGMAAEIPFAGVLIAALISAAGHLGNAAINALSAFIHTVRLQFVEFFTKFYEGGGKEFRPFAYETEFIEEKNIREFP